MRTTLRLALAATLVAVVGCRDTPAEPTDGSLVLEQTPAEATCLVTPSGTQWGIQLAWNRVPTQQIRLIRETIPGPPPHDEFLLSQKRKGTLNITLDFLPTVAFFVDRKLNSVRATCTEVN